MQLLVLSLSLSFPPKLAFVFFFFGVTHHLSAVFHVFHVDGVTRVSFHADDVTTSLRNTTTHVHVTTFHSVRAACAFF